MGRNKKSKKTERQQKRKSEKEQGRGVVAGWHTSELIETSLDLDLLVLKVRTIYIKEVAASGLDADGPHSINFQRQNAL